VSNKAVLLEQLKAEVKGHLEAARKVVNDVEAKGQINLSPDEQALVNHHRAEANRLIPQMKALSERVAQEKAVGDELHALSDSLFKGAVNAGTFGGPATKAAHRRGVGESGRPAVH
jgi:hypothetical protein